MLVMVPSALRLDDVTLTGLGRATVAQSTTANYCQSSVQTSYKQFTHDFFNSKVITKTTNYTMSFLTQAAAMLRTAGLRPGLSMTRARQQVRFATSDYGSGAGNPAGEKPEEQGANLSEGLEHPGPAPPKVAKGQSSSSPNNDDAPGKSSRSKSSTSAGQQSPSHDGASKSGKQGAQPKLAANGPPSKENESEDVKQHNREMEQRADAFEQADKQDRQKDKVSKDYWKGESFAMY
ncbi:hypothetical protein BDU57DRAFT_509151 [Ampelomyces quisqualis]|uniref:Uncharacterized protein n=1 Tax=Ampelomyces quisqualis TaxID=50730 RepID=A0A6A5QZ39_AMPQU|nr:hypothetical protein BDU57DRAFT_509151 [Ampelomyces quisqualis]